MISRILYGAMVPEGKEKLLDEPQKKDYATNVILDIFPQEHQIIRRLLP